MLVISTLSRRRLKLAMVQDDDVTKEKDEDREAVEKLSGSTNKNAAIDIDEDDIAIAEEYELPGAELTDEEVAVDIISLQKDEFICSKCFLVKHRSQLDHLENGLPVCKECA